MGQQIKCLFELVLPCYNEEKSLMKIVDNTIKAARSYGFCDKSFKLLLVENGSKDNSQQVCEELLQNLEISPWIKVVRIKENKGYGNGIYQGLRASSADVIGWTHADEQCDPLDAFRGYEALKKSHKQRVLVKGSRVGRKLVDKCISRIFEKLASVHLGYTFHEINAQPKIFHRGLLEICSSPPLDFSFDLYFVYMSLKHGFYIETILVKFPARTYGFSNWSYGIKNKFKHIKRMILYMRQLAKSEREL